MSQKNGFICGCWLHKEDSKDVPRMSTVVNSIRLLFALPQEGERLYSNADNQGSEWLAILGHLEPAVRKEREAPGMVLIANLTSSINPLTGAAESWSKAVVLNLWVTTP